MYQENTLSILVEPLHFPACVCDQCGSLWAHTPVIEDNALVQKLDYGQTGYNIDVQKFVLSFRSFQLELGEDVLLKGVRKFADMVDYLAPILHARRVTIKLLISDTIANDPTVRLSLKMLGAFDCASIKFLGPSTPYTRMLGANHPEGRVIPKHILPALDPPLQNMRLVKHQLMHIYRATDKVNWIEKKDTEMIAAYRRQDVPAFEKAREEIVERYQRANQIVEDSAYNHDFLLDNLGRGHWGVARDGSRTVSRMAIAYHKMEKEIVHGRHATMPRCHHGISIMRKIAPLSLLQPKFSGNKS